MERNRKKKAEMSIHRSPPVDGTMKQNFFLILFMASLKSDIDH